MTLDALMGGLLVTAFLMFWWEPRLFVQIQPEDTPEVRNGLRKIFHSYQWEMAIAWAVVLACYTSLGPTYRTLVYAAAVLVCGASGFRLQWRVRGLRIAHAPVRKAYLVVDELEQLPRWPWAAAITVLALAAIYLTVAWWRIPSRFPAYWDFAGNANRWSERTIWGVFSPLLIGLGSVILLYAAQRFQRWFLRRNWSTFGVVLRVHSLAGLRVQTYLSTLVALGSAAVALWLPFYGRPDTATMLGAVLWCFAGVIVIAILVDRETHIRPINFPDPQPPPQ